MSNVRIAELMDSSRYFADPSFFRIDSLTVLSRNGVIFTKFPGLYVVVALTTRFSMSSIDSAAKRLVVVVTLSATRSGFSHNTVRSRVRIDTRSGSMP